MTFPKSLTHGRFVRFAPLTLLAPLALAGCGGGSNGLGSAPVVPPVAPPVFDPFSAVNYVFQSQFGNSGAGALSGPYGLARDAQGNTYVTEVASGTTGRVLKFGPSGSYLTQFGTTGAGQLTEPEQVATDGAGNVYVADYANGQAGAVSRVVKYDPSGTFVSQFGSTGTAATGLLSFPVGVAVDPQGDVYVTDGAAGSPQPGRVVKFGPTGTFLAQFGTSGSGLLTAPEGITLDAQGDVYVADYNAGQPGVASRVVEFDPTGVYLTQFGATGTAATGLLSGPQGVAVDPRGNVYVSDAVSAGVVKFDRTGRYLTTFDTTGPGSAQASDPLGLALDGSGNVYAADGNLNSVLVFHPQPGASPAARPRVSVGHTGPHHGHA